MDVQSLKSATALFSSPNNGGLSSNLDSWVGTLELETLLEVFQIPPRERSWRLIARDVSQPGGAMANFLKLSKSKIVVTIYLALAVEYLRRFQNNAQILFLSTTKKASNLLNNYLRDAHTVRMLSKFSRFLVFVLTLTSVAVIMLNPPILPLEIHYGFFNLAFM